MMRVSSVAASAAPSCSGTDDGVGGGRRFRARSKIGAVVGGCVVEDVLDVTVVVLVSMVIVVVGMVSDVVLSVGAVTVVGTVIVVEEMVSDVVLRVGTVTVVGTVIV